MNINSFLFVNNAVFRKKSLPQPCKRLYNIIICVSFSECTAHCAVKFKCVSKCVELRLCEHFHMVHPVGTL